MKVYMYATSSLAPSACRATVPQISAFERAHQSQRSQACRNMRDGVGPLGRYSDPTHTTVHSADTASYQKNMREMAHLRDTASRVPGIGCARRCTIRSNRSAFGDGPLALPPAQEIAGEKWRPEEITAMLGYMRRSCGGVSHRLVLASAAVRSIVTAVIVGEVRVSVAGGSNDARKIRKDSPVFVNVLEPTPGCIILLQALKFTNPPLTSYQEYCLQWPVHESEKWGSIGYGGFDFRCLCDALELVEHAHMVWVSELVQLVCLVLKRRALPCRVGQAIADLVLEGVGEAVTVSRKDAMFIEHACNPSIWHAVMTNGDIEWIRSPQAVVIEMLERWKHMNASLPRSTRVMSIEENLPSFG